jgi:hypothetical protein
MNSLFCLTVFTANILGSFCDPFEFEGDYGEEIQPTRKFVFEQVVSKEALATHLTDAQIKQLIKQDNPSEEEIREWHQQFISQAIQEDLQHGPALKEVVTPALMQQLIEKQQELQFDGFHETDLQNFLDFIKQYGDQKIFSFLRRVPSKFLSLGKTLQDKAVNEGKEFDLPILGSTQPLQETDPLRNLLNSLFTKEILRETKEIDSFNDPMMSIFTSPAGQVFFYWLYESLNLHLISEAIPQINQVKYIFAERLGNPKVRAQTFRDQLMAADASVVFTQESDTFVPEALCGDGLFLSISPQNPKDGTFIFLRADVWDPHYQVIAIDDYNGYAKGRLNVILATQQNQKFLLASCHGHSTQAEDGRLQITKVMQKFHELKRKNNDLQLIIGIDANTKSEKDIELLRAHLSSLGLIATSVGPTTIKKRMVTLQHTKAGRFAVDEEDYIIVLKPESGGQYRMTRPTVGFKEEKPDPAVTIPNIHCLSDHYPVGVTLEIM